MNVVTDLHFTNSSPPHPPPRPPHGCLFLDVVLFRCVLLSGLAGVLNGNPQHEIGIQSLVSAIRKSSVSSCLSDVFFLFFLLVFKSFLPVESQASVSASGKSGFSFCRWKVRLQFLPVESQASVSAGGKSGFSFCRWKIRVWCLQVKRVLFPHV